MSSNSDKPVSSSGQKKCELFVEFPNFVPIMDLSSHLKDRIHSSTEFTFEKLPKSSAGTIVKLGFTSKNMAQRAAEGIRKYNERENTIILKCSFNKRALETLSCDYAGQGMTLQRIKSDMEKKALKLLQNQDLKIEAIKMKLSTLPMKNKSLSEFCRIQEERKALEHKLKELHDQREEFCIQVNEKILARLEEPKLLRNFDHTVASVRKNLEDEMTRLDKALPIFGKRQEIVSVVLNNSVCVVLGETGSGKSTQLPQYLYEAGLGDTGMIACTQPRKVAVTSLATHVAAEMASDIGQLVGYRVGATKKISQATKIVYLTDYILLNEILTDPILRKYSCVIVDEAHERSVYTDLLLGMIKKCLQVRSELRVVVTSAKIDPEMFIRYFNGCPILEVPGQTFPVDVFWPDPRSLTPFENHTETAVRVAANIHEIEDEGDILVFLASPIETEKCCARLEETLGHRNDYECFQLHEWLQSEEQQAVFEPLTGRKRKIVCATNIAETSVTIPGIKYVVDSGLVNEMRYDPKKGLSSLDTVAISKPSAEQRKGRAGRTSSGKCFRLYMEEDYEKMETGSLAEILRINPAQALLKLLHLGVDPLVFDFVQSPSKGALERAMEELEDMDASRDGKMTDLGRVLAALPFDLRLGELVLQGIARGIAYEAVSLAALTTVGFSLFYRSGSETEKGKSGVLKTRFCHPDGDHLTMLNVYREWLFVPEKDKSKWCVMSGINAKSLYMVEETANEIVTALKKHQLEAEIKFLPPAETEQQLKDIIFNSSKMTHVAMYLGQPEAGYLAAAQRQRAHIHPSSSVNILGGEFPEWVVFEQLINTSNDFLAIVSPVDKERVRKAFLNGELKFDPEVMEKSKVTRVITKELGQEVLKEFVGKRFCNEKSVEAEVTKRTQGNIVCVDLDTARIRIQTHVSESDANCVSEVLNGRLLPVLDRLRNAETEIPVTENSTCVRVILGSGGNMHDLLFSSDYRHVYVEGVSVNTDMEKIENWLSRYGFITDCHPFRRRTPSQSSRWSIINAQQAVTEKSQSVMNRLLPCLTGSQKLRGFTLKLTWTRRALKGFGFLYLKNIEDIPALLCHRNLMIDGHFVDISLNRKDPTNIYMTSLPPTATEEKVMVAVRELLFREENGNVVEKVVLIRENDFETLETQIENLKRELLSQMSDICVGMKRNIELPVPRRRAVFYTAFIHFINPNDGIEVINAISCEMDILREEVEISLGENSACVRAALGSGSSVHDLLFASNDRNVYCEEISVKMEIDEIERCLSRYKVIIDSCPPWWRAVSQSTWGTVTFRDKSTAHQAVTEEKRSGTKRILPCVTSSREGKVREFTLRLTWSKRALDGLGFLYLRKQKYVDSLLSRPILRLDGQSVKISPNKKDPTEIYMKFLPPTATVEKIIGAVRHQLSRGETARVVAKVVLLREFEKGIETLKEELLFQISQLCPGKKLNLQLRSPNPEALFYTAFLQFTNPNDGVEVFNALFGELDIFGEKIYVQQDLSNTICVPRYLFRVVKRDLKDLENVVEVRKKWKGVKISRKKSKAGNVYINVSSDNSMTLASMKKTIDNILAGQRVELSSFSSVLQGLVRKEGRDRLDGIQTETRTLIRIDFQGVLVIGSRENRRKAVALIKRYLKMLFSCSVKNFGLNNGSLPRGLMKHVLELYGVDWSEFRKETGVEGVELDFRKQILRVTGTESSLQSASDKLEYCAEHLVAPSNKQADWDVECVVCFCPITEGQLYRLNLCGHAYCLDCAKFQVQTAVDKRDLPLRCALDGCEELWCLKDVEQLVTAGGRTLHQLVRAALHSFMAQNKELYHYCLIPNCFGVFPLSSKRKLFICEECKTRICTSCKVQYHDGLTCAMYNSGRDLRS